MEALDPAPGVDESAQRAFLDGEYRRAVTLLSAVTSTVTRQRLLAQVELRRGDPAAAIAALDVHDALTGGASTAGAQALRAAALATLGEEEAARAAIERAHECGPIAGDVVEVDFNDAYVAWMLGDLERARNITGRYINDLAAPVDLQARFLMLRGWLFAAVGRYREQAAAARAAIERLESAPHPDAGLVAWALYAFAAVVRDIDVPGAREDVIRLEGSLRWTGDLIVPHFQVVRAIAWTHALAGEYIQSFRRFNEALRLATTPFTAMVVHLDRAEVARFSRQDMHGQADMDEAIALIERYDWELAVGEEARALIHAAELLAVSDANRAAMYLERARGLAETMSRNAGYAHDDRLAAHADYAEALIRVNRSERRLARHRARRAFRIFESIGYEWRAARCALLLDQIGDQGDWLDRARNLIRAYPRSFIAVQIDALGPERNPLTQLTHRQLQVLELLAKGKRSKEAGEELGITEHTVRAHISAIHRAFGVERRAELLAKNDRLVEAVAEYLTRTA